MKFAILTLTLASALSIVTSCAPKEHIWYSETKEILIAPNYWKNYQPKLQEDMKKKGYSKTYSSATSVVFTHLLNLDEISQFSGNIQSEVLGGKTTYTFVSRPFGSLEAISSVKSTTLITKDYGTKEIYRTTSDLNPSQADFLKKIALGQNNFAHSIKECEKNNNCPCDSNLKTVPSAQSQKDFTPSYSTSGDVRKNK